MDSIPKIRVKMIARGCPSSGWLLQTPGKSGICGSCQILCDLHEPEYDWLVVIDDVSRTLSATPEHLACDPRHTILVTTEPSSITRYGNAFARQFAYVLTSQEGSALPHPNRIHSHTGNYWFYGKSYDELVQEDPPPKTGLIGTVCSSKQQKRTLHAKRHEFTRRLKAELPVLDVFGHGVRYVEHKYESIDPYRFHLAIENHVARHHWTEKLADAFLGYSVPIYHGCPNVGDYFPEESLVRIDINDFNGTLEALRRILSEEGEYERRLEAVVEARRRVLHEHNLPFMLDRIIANAAPDAVTGSGSRKIYGRKQMRARSLGDLASFIAWKAQGALCGAALPWRITTTPHRRCDKGF